MKKYLVIFVVLGILLALFLTQFLTCRSPSEPESGSWVSLLQNAAPAEPSPLVAQNAVAAEPKHTVPPPVLPTAEPPKNLPPETSQTVSLAVPQETPKLIPFVYLYPLPQRHYNPVVYYVQPIQPVVAPQPVLPIYYPQQVVPSRFGSPKLVYPNGVVIKPKVYFPHQPVRNILRGITP
ncbi:hypothetical protein FACS1894189_4980 [Planctomycetales bacterium]|nr:hypothetical protein FACS1894189_4980 [Planctomycetales bacterium]